MWHDGRQHSPWLPWNLPVDVTGKEPRQSGDERSEVIPSWDETEAWWEAGLLNPSEGETEEPSRVGRWRQQKGPDEPQSAVEEEKVKEYKPQENDRLTAVPRAGALQFLHQKQSGAQGEALEENEASHGEWKFKLNELGHRKHNHSCLVRVKKVTWAETLV